MNALNKLETIIVQAGKIFDLLAGLILAGTAFLVTANVVGRTFFNRSVLGTYEMVGFLTAAVVGLSLARCAAENGHIAIEFILDKFKPGLQRLTGLITGVPITIFLFFAAHKLFAYGLRLAQTNEVSPTTQMVFYPFIYLVGLGFLLLALVVLVQFLKNMAGGVKK